MVSVQWHCGGIERVHAHDLQAEWQVSAMSLQWHWGGIDLVHGQLLQQAVLLDVTPPAPLSFKASASTVIEEKVNRNRTTPTIITIAAFLLNSFIFSLCQGGFVCLSFDVCEELRRQGDLFINKFEWYWSPEWFTIKQNNELWPQYSEDRYLYKRSF